MQLCTDIVHCVGGSNGVPADVAQVAGSSNVGVVTAANGVITATKGLDSTITGDGTFTLTPTQDATTKAISWGAACVPTTLC